MKINYTHLPVKVHYFFFMGVTSNFFLAMGAIMQYIPVYGKQLGISSLIMGSIIAILPIACLIGKLMIGYAADYFPTWRKTIFMTLFAVTCTCYILIYFIPALPSPILDHPFQNVSCESLLSCDMHHHASALVLCNGTKDTMCHWKCDNMNFSMRLSFHSPEKKAIISSDTTCLLNINDTSLCQRNEIANYNCNVTCNNFEDDQCLYTSVTFWGFVILMFFGNVGYYISLSVNETICFDILGENEQMRYGKQRLWGSIGYSFLAFLSGYSIELWSQGKIYKTYTPAFILVLIFICIDLICFRKLKLPLTISPNILKDVCAILKLRPIIIFLCITFLCGIFEAVTINFLFWFIEDLAMATGYMSQVKLIEGLATALGFLCSKVLFFFMSGKILERFGYGYTITFCFICYALRLGLISLVPTPWYIILVESILQGPTFALFYATVMTYASIISPPGTSATVLAIATGMKDGFGYMIGSFLTGFFFKEIGSTMTFKIYSGLAALCALIYIIIYISYLKHTTVDVRNNVEWRKPDVARRECAVDQL